MERRHYKNFRWNKKLAYIIGLLVSDGNLSKDGRHIIFVSKDLDLIRIFRDYLGLKNKIRRKGSGFSKLKKYYYIQFADVSFYSWLERIGLHPDKSKTIRKVIIPDKYFPTFAKGLLDGDGNINTFKHPESRYPQLRLRFVSGSYKFLFWLRKEIKRILNCEGRISQIKRGFLLIYYKSESIRILRKIYNEKFLSLRRKYIQAGPFLKTSPS